MVAMSGGKPAPANEEVARRLDEVADYLEAEHDNPFRVRAYRTAADTVRRLDRPLSTVIGEEGTDGLRRLPGIGSALARAIDQLARTGELGLLDELRGRLSPEGLLATVPGVGPGLAHRIHEQLGVRSLEELEAAAHDGRLAEVPGLGPRRLRGIREALAGRFRQRRPVSPSDASVSVEELLRVDALYREQTAAGALPRIAPRRFNPGGEAWLPVLRLRRGGRRFRALYSNTAQAHNLGKTRDWVVIYCDSGGERRQWTVVTAASGRLQGRRVVRGREEECARYYAETT